LKAWLIALGIAQLFPIPVAANPVVWRNYQGWIDTDKLLT
jgi:hypothetical protein